MSLGESSSHTRRTLLLSGLTLAAVGASGTASAAPGIASPPGHKGARYVPAGSGLSIWLSGGDAYTFKATSEQTDGAFSFVEASVPPSGGPPIHTHPENDEAFFLISGSLEFAAGGKILTAGPGDFVHVPPGVPHRFKNVGIQTVHMLFMFAPGDADQWLIEHGTPAVPGERPPLP